MNIKYIKNLLLPLIILFALGAGFFIYSNYSKDGFREGGVTIAAASKTTAAASETIAAASEKKPKRNDLRHLLRRSNKEVKKGSNKVKNWFKNSFGL